MIKCQNNLKNAKPTKKNQSLSFEPIKRDLLDVLSIANKGEYHFRFRQNYTKNIFRDKCIKWIIFLWMVFKALFSKLKRCFRILKFRFNEIARNSIFQKLLLNLFSSLFFHPSIWVIMICFYCYILSWQ